MHHPNQIYQRILSVIAAQNGLPITPSFVAYEIDTTTAKAEELLDEMVRQSMLEYDFDAHGEIAYRPGTAYPYDEIGGAAHRAETSTGWDEAGWAAADATVGRAEHRHGRATRRARGYGDMDGDVATVAPQSHGYTSRLRPNRRERATRPSARRGASRRHSSLSPAPRGAVIGPNGCDGSVGQPGDLPTQRHTPPAPEHHLLSQKHRRFHDSMNHPGSQMIPSANHQLSARKMHKAEPVLAAVLSLFFAGSGQLYNGEVAKGIAFFISFLILWSFALGWIVQIWAAVDAYQTATTIRQLSAD